MMTNKPPGTRFCVFCFPAACGWIRACVCADEEKILIIVRNRKYAMNSRYFVPNFLGRQWNEVVDEKMFANQPMAGGHFAFSSAPLFPVDSSRE
jgi:hypothetical protein